MYKTVLCFLLFPLLGATKASAGEPLPGPVVEGYGPVFKIPADSYNLDPTQHYRVVMDVGKGPDDPAELNRGIESAARGGRKGHRLGLDGGGQARGPANVAQVGDQSVRDIQGRADQGARAQGLSQGNPRFGQAVVPGQGGAIRLVQKRKTAL